MLKKKAIAGFIILCMLLVLPCTNIFAAGYSLTATPENPTPGDEIRITAAGLSKDEMEDAWIGMYDEGAKDSQYGDWVNVSDLPADNTWVIKAPTDNKKYCFKLFLTNEPTNPVAISNWITVGSKSASFEISAPPVHMNAKMSVKIGNIPDTRAYDSAWVGLYKLDSKDEQYDSYVNVSSLPANNTWEFNAPMELGKFEFRAFADSGYKLPMGKSATFEVVLDTPTFKLEKTTYAINEEIKVTFEKEPVTGSAWIGFFERNAKDDQYIEYKYLNDLDKTKVYTVKAAKSGEYNFRMFEDNKNTLCGVSQTIIVTAQVAPGEDLPGNNNGTTVIVPNIDGAASWAKPEITEAYQLNLTTDKVLIDFQDALTREEFCELAIKLYERMKGEKAQPVANNPFTDTINPEILKAYNLGIVKGMSATSFAPNSNVTRAEIAVMLLRTLKCVMPNVNTKVTNYKPFFDEKDIPAWATDAVKFFSTNGIINGSNGYILPKANTTKEQGIALVKRVYDKFFSI